MGNKTPSPKLHRMDSKAFKQQDRELQWYEKELNKIEKEKGRLEKERQKYMETEEKLSKLRRTVTGGNKKDILVHTPCGFYKFEGISRKFTQKLYEWEKSRGIGPESSTFALLNPGYPNPSIPKVKINGKDQTPPLTRSRSVDSMVASTMECPLKSQPSSLSLNDVDELEATCLRNSKTSSVDFIPCSEMEAEEPEALIVEVEDFVEETAAPLKSFIEQHNPVYQCESVRALCEGETCLAPKIRRSESRRAQTNYNLIEEVFTALNQITDNDDQIRKDRIECIKDEKSEKFQQDCDRQKYFVFKVTDKLLRLQEANALVVLNITKENQNYPSNHIIDVLEIVQDLTIEIVGLSEKLNELVDKTKYEKLSSHDCDSSSVQEITDEIRSKLLELRRHLSYVCAVSDSTAPMKRGLCKMKPIVCEKSSNESYSTVSDLSQNSEMSGLARKGGIYEKFDSKNQQSQGAVKKRIRYRVENIRRKSLQDSDDEELSYSIDQKKCPKFLRARTLSDTSTRSSEPEEAMKNKNTNIFPVATKSTFTESPAKINPTDSPVTIFVKTTRKLFTPLIERSLTESELLKRECKPKAEHVDARKNSVTDSKNEVVLSAETHDFHDVKNVELSSLPPLPTSPVAQKKYSKDISPNIRLMLNKYHQKLSSQDSCNKSGGSSGSASPKAWRSPTAERRVKTQTEKYLEELSKSSSRSISNEVQKSASQSAIGKESRLPSNVTKSNTSSSFTERNILKSTSAADLLSSNSEVPYFPVRASSEKSKPNNQTKTSNLNSSMHPMDVIWSERLLRTTREAKEG
ncbi:hypothetical protein WA026_014467 [Henosepilachna vigintioctopunctata]|uniref:Uncharacterized protein n=1 Tax=Henosepilachna vigintioctopunctata TaxID=420089 RepID=A0AAW1UDQ9_9CUCU